MLMLPRLLLAINIDKNFYDFKCLNAPSYPKSSPSRYLAEHPSHYKRDDILHSNISVFLLDLAEYT